ncbi:hypothetical protein RHGRI_017834 [Rhododendron griersonianum]|uniref:FAS1 domain-containing protein n=1 Tax=Rhododendron griersonianum TaxID=479676 RepID=A0AAV6JZA3_9ERIC|nr:hypothetical protein RHGRI_017834 [Rhododendron griersonianum]
MADSCSHWWHCPFYFAMSITLALIAISASIHLNQTPSPQTPLPHNLSFAASLALRRHGFAATATLLQISPELLLSSPETTLFAIRDSAFSNISAHPDSMKQLLKYHACPFRLPMGELSKNLNGTCFSTLVPRKSIAITGIDPKQGRPSSTEINNVLITHPDLFLGGPISIHGVLGPFSTLPVNETDRDWEITQPSVCNSSGIKISSAGEFKNTVEWNRIVSFMSSNGFVSFAIRLRSVLDGILVDYPDLNTVTIFAPLDFLFVTPSWPLLDRMVRFHMVPQRLTFVELAPLPEKSILSTLVPGGNLVITRNAYPERRAVAVNGVEIVAPDSFTSEHFVVHGIAGAFTMEELPSM